MYLNRKGNTMNSILKNKQGQFVFEDVFYALAFVFFAAIFTFILYFAFNQAKPELGTIIDSNLPVGYTGQNATTLLNKVSNTVQMFDVLFPFLIIGLVIMLMVSAMFVQSHPVFFVVTIIILGVAVLMGVIFSNTYQQITTDPSFANTADDFPITNVFMKYLPYLIGLTVLITAVVIFTKSGASNPAL